MTLDEFNHLDFEKAYELLLNCCHSKAWATSLATNRPYSSRELLISKAEKIWNGLTVQDHLEAFEAHPKIGDLKSLKEKYSATKTLAGKEQQSVETADTKTLERLKDLNEEYFNKFGFIFIVFATGKTASQMLELLESRIHNSRDEELKNAAIEQSKIMRLRMEKML